MSEASKKSDLSRAFSEDGQLDTWTDMVSIDASGQFILGIHADGNDEFVKQRQRPPDDRLMATGEGVKRPGKQ